MTRDPRGFTLLEVLVALIVAATVLLSAHWMAGAVADATERVAEEGGAADARANSERLLRRLAATAEPAAAPFRGNRQIMRWSTWCDTADGWQERCTVELAMVQRREGATLLLALPHGQLVVVREAVRRGGFRYLTAAGGRGSWTGEWAASSPPAAVAAEMDSDTLILPMFSAF